MDAIIDLQFNVVFDVVAPDAPGFQNVAMHLDHVLGPSSQVKAVDILRDQSELFALAFELFLNLDQSSMALQMSG